MIHAIIVDDEIKVLRSLHLLIDKFVPDVKVVAISTDSSEAVELINNYRPDMVFLDIYMPGLNGFQLLEKLTFKNFHLVFTTAHGEHALEAIKKNALDYLLKPVNIEELQNAVNRAKSAIENNEKNADVFAYLKRMALEQNIKIALPVKTSIEYVSPADISYIQADHKNAIVTLRNGNVINVLKSLKEFEEQLCVTGLNFLRIHISFIANMNCALRYVKENPAYIVMEGQKKIPVSKNGKNGVRNFLKL